MKIFVTGYPGMLARTIVPYFKDMGCEVIPSTIEELELTDRDAVMRTLKEIMPDVIIHCAAITAVDACEDEVELAMSVNEGATRNIALACNEIGARLVAISTDYVFSGDGGAPYSETDATNPKSVYGKSKLAGEKAVEEICEKYIIARIAWLYGAGGPSFVHTMLRLGAQSGDPLKVVDDQIGSPTSTMAVTRALYELIKNDAQGIFHLSCEGKTSWYGFVQEIFSIAGLKREVLPCTTEEYPLPAPRPLDSRLDNKHLRDSGYKSMPQWQDALAEFLPDEIERLKNA